MDRQEALFHSIVDSGDQVALKGILRNGAATQQVRPMPMDSFNYPEFTVPGRAAPVKPVDEKQILIASLEKQIEELKRNVTSAKAEGKALAESSFAKGRAEGLAAGLKEGQAKAEQAYEAKIAQFQQELAGTLQALNNAYGSRIQEVEHQCVELALGLARKLFSIEAKKHPERIQHIIAEAFSHIGQAETVILHLNPMDSVSANATRNFWQPINSALKSVQIEPDARVEQGGCWIESAGGGTVDMRTPIMLERLEQAVNASLLRTSDSAADAA